ncbi:MAG: Gfo/Idh/MocA family oxidoreductase, partial [Deltaproteobacteria bacterium]
LGELMFLRGRYGHGGRVGYEQEWRADVTKSGGGELIDQGPHLIDLSRWIFEEEFTEIQGHAQTYFWEMSVDDNAFLTLRTPTGKTAFLHVSCSEWKNLFSLEIYGKLGKLEISGLGGSYGIEKLTWYKMLPEMGPPETRSWEFPMADNSWSLEMQDFFEDIQQQRSPSASLSDAYEALKIIHQIYQNSNCDYCA